MKVWITKYALTKGIYEANVRLCLSAEPTGNMVEEVGIKYSTYYHGKGKDWHETQEGALVKADAMRKFTIASLKKKIAKLEALKFETK